MNSTQEILKYLIDEYNYSCGVLVNEKGETLYLAGDCQAPAPEKSDVFNDYFRDSKTIKKSFGYLKDKIIPHFYREGNRTLTLYKPRPDLILGCISNDERNMVEIYYASIKINEKIQELFANVSL